MVEEVYEDTYPEVGYDNNVEEISDEAVTSPSGNMHIMIIVISVCVVVGLILGIISGRRAAK